jgi:SAM-dependent methyltransferase
MEHPHDKWAQYYEYVYEKTFGPMYSTFTESTLAAIRSIREDGLVLDFGAGTGRLSIPLKKMGYDVIAVERSAGMVQAFKQNCLDNNLEIPLHECSISDYRDRDGKLSICLFTVLSYSTSEYELFENLKAMCIHVKPTGYFFFDLPNSGFFREGVLMDIQSNDFRRRVTLTKTAINRNYSYREECSGVYNGVPFHYEDEFMICNWDMELVDYMLTNLGLFDTGRQFSEFSGTGSTYKLYQRRVGKSGRFLD